ncbi:hypothetical protein Tco_1533305 [Tanacetum coccineum]
MVPAGSSWFLLVVPAGRLCGSYWSAYGFFCLPCPILFVIAASIIETLDQIGCLIPSYPSSAPSIFDTTPKDVEGKPLYNKFVKTDRMKAVPPPLSGNYIPLSDPTGLDESQMTYGPKQPTL